MGELLSIMTGSPVAELYAILGVAIFLFLWVVTGWVQDFLRSRRHKKEIQYAAESAALHEKIRIAKKLRDEVNKERKDKINALEDPDHIPSDLLR